MKRISQIDKYLANFNLLLLNNWQDYSGNSQYS
jgi:hypothetical protein